MAVSLQRLKALVAVSETRSVGAAADALGVSASAITKSIRELEHALGRVTLFKRTADGMIATQVGELFTHRAKLALSEIAKGREEIDALRGGKAISIVVGALPDGHPIVPRAIARFLNQRSDVNVVIRGGRLSDHVQATRTGSMDLFFGVNVDIKQIDDLTSEEIGTDEVIFVARPEHPLARSKKIHLDQTMDQRWALPDAESPVWQLTKDKISAYGLPAPSEWIIVHPFGALRTLLLESNMISVSARMRLQEEITAGLLVALPVDIAPSTLSIRIVHRPHDLLSSTVRSLLSTIRQIAKT